MFEKKRLHPVAAISNTIKQLKEAVFPIVFAFVVGSTGEDASILEKLMIYVVPGAVILLTVVSGVVKWLRYSYWIEDDELRIEYGLFVRKKRYIPIERIQSISTSEGIIQRLFGLVQLNVETAGGGMDGAEANLTAITKQEAKDLQQHIHLVKQRSKTVSDDTSVMNQQEAVVVEQEKNIIYSMSTREIFILAISSGGALGVIAAVLAFLSQFDELFSFDVVFDKLQEFVTNGIILAVVMSIFGIVVAYIIAIIRTMLKYANFTLEKTEEDLIVSQGLLEKKNITVPLKRVQGIKIKENLIRSFFGLATVYVINGGGSITEGDNGRIMICPLIKKSKIAGIIDNSLPEYKIDVPFINVPKRAKIRYMLRPILAAIIPLGLGIYFLFPWGLLSLFSLPILAYIGYRGYTFAGWNISGDQLALRKRFINASTVFMFKHKIQAIASSKSWFQRRKNLGSVVATVMAGFAGESGETVDLDEEDLQTIYFWYSRGE